MPVNVCDKFDDDVDDAAELISEQPVDTIRHVARLIGFKYKDVKDALLPDYFRYTLQSRPLQVRQQALRQAEYYCLHGEWAAAAFAIDASPPQQHGTPPPSPRRWSLDLDMADIHTPGNGLDIGLETTSGNAYPTPRSQGDFMDTGWSDIDCLPEEHKGPTLDFNINIEPGKCCNSNEGADLDAMDLSHEHDPFFNVLSSETVQHSIPGAMHTSSNESTLCPGHTDRNPTSYPSSIVYTQHGQYSVDGGELSDGFQDRSADLFPDNHQTRSPISTPCPEPTEQGLRFQHKVGPDATCCESPASHALQETNPEHRSTPDIQPPTLGVESCSSVENGPYYGDALDADLAEEPHNPDTGSLLSLVESVESEVCPTLNRGLCSGANHSPELHELSNSESEHVKGRAHEDTCESRMNPFRSESPVSVTATTTAAGAQNPNPFSGPYHAKEPHSLISGDHRNNNFDFIMPVPETAPNTNTPRNGQQNDTRGRSSASSPSRHSRDLSMSSELRRLLEEEDANAVHRSDHLFCYSPTPAPLFDEMSISDTNDHRPSTTTNAGRRNSSPGFDSGCPGSPLSDMMADSDHDHPTLAGGSQHLGYSPRLDTSSTRAQSPTPSLASPEEGRFSTPEMPGRRGPAPPEPAGTTRIWAPEALSGMQWEHAYVAAAEELVKCMPMLKLTLSRFNDRVEGLLNTQQSQGEDVEAMKLRLALLEGVKQDQGETIDGLKTKVARQQKEMEALAKRVGILEGSKRG